MDLANGGARVSGSPLNHVRLQENLGQPERKAGRETDHWDGFSTASAESFLGLRSAVVAPRVKSGQAVSLAGLSFLIRGLRSSAWSLSESEQFVALVRHPQFLV